MDKAWIEEVIGIAEKWDLDALEVEDKHGAIRVVRRSGGAPVMAAPNTATTTTPAKEESPARDFSVKEVVTSHMVGIFSVAGGEGGGAAPAVGDSISQGQVLGFVEAMKMSSEVTAHCPGTLFEILVADGQAVQFGDPLFLITPAPSGE